MRKIFNFLCLSYFGIAGLCFAENREIELGVDQLISDISNHSSSVKNSTRHAFKKVVVPEGLSVFGRKMNSKEVLISKLAVRQFMNEAIEFGSKEKRGPVVYFEGMYQSTFGAVAFKFKRRGEKIWELGVAVNEIKNKKMAVTIGEVSSDVLYGSYIFNELNEMEFSCVTGMGDEKNPLKFSDICVSPKNGSVEISHEYFRGEKYFESEMSEEANNFLQGSLSKAALKVLWRKKLDKMQKELVAKNIDIENSDIPVKTKININFSNTSPAADGSFTIRIQTNADTASLKINGEEQGGRSDGKYFVERIARVGAGTEFTIVATDTNGNTDTKTITVNRPVVESKPLIAALNPAHIKRQLERDAVAIIIGIADYKNLPRADYANDDARMFYDYAIRALGVKPENIKLLVDADADDIGVYQAFKTWLPSRVRLTTDVYVYYSGHGLPTADGQGIYLLPQRAHRDFIDKTAITQAEINTAIQAAKPRSVTIFLDACYSGQARTGETLLASARPVTLKVEQQLFPNSFTVISASQADQISSSSPDLKHGIFSYYLMRGMEGDADSNRDGRITTGEMHQYLTEQVARQAGIMNRKQIPQLIGDANRVLVGR
jgi:hypothetical protein